MATGSEGRGCDGRQHGHGRQFIGHSSRLHSCAYQAALDSGPVFRNHKSSDTLVLLVQRPLYQYQVYVVALHSAGQPREAQAVLGQALKRMPGHHGPLELKGHLATAH